MTTELEWAELPPKSTGMQGILQPMKDALRSNPGKWGIVHKVKAGKQASRLQHFRRSDGFETASRKQPDGSIWGYARYVGNAHPAADQFD